MKQRMNRVVAASCLGCVKQRDLVFFSNMSTPPLPEIAGTCVELEGLPVAVPLGEMTASRTTTTTTANTMTTPTRLPSPVYMLLAKEDLNAPAFPVLLPYQLQPTTLEGIAYIVPITSVVETPEFQVLPQFTALQNTGRDTLVTWPVAVVCTQAASDLEACTAAAVRVLLADVDTAGAATLARFIRASSFCERLQPPGLWLQQNLSFGRILTLCATWCTGEADLDTFRELTAKFGQPQWRALLGFAAEYDNAWLQQAVLDAALPTATACSISTEGAQLAWQELWQAAMPYGLDVWLRVLQKAEDIFGPRLAQRKGFEALPLLPLLRLLNDKSGFLESLRDMDSAHFAHCVLDHIKAQVAAERRVMKDNGSQHGDDDDGVEVSTMTWQVPALTYCDAATMRSALRAAVAAGVPHHVAVLLEEPDLTTAWQPHARAYQAMARELAAAMRRARACPSMTVPKVLLETLTWHDDGSGAAFRALDTAFHTGDMAKYPATEAYMTLLHPDMVAALERKMGKRKPNLGMSGVRLQNKRSLPPSAKASSVVANSSSTASGPVCVMSHSSKRQRV